MTQTSIINPEFILNFKLKHSIVPSFCNSKINPQIDKCMFLKSFEMINTHCSKPIISFDRISQIDGDDHLDDDSTNHFIFDGSGRFGASLVPKASNSIMRDHIIPVRKSADAAPENGNLRGHLNANGDTNGSDYTGGYNGAPVPPRLSGGNDGEAANTGGGGLGYGNIDNGNWVEGLRIQVYNVDSQLVRTIFTNTVAKHLSSWFVLAGRIYRYWQINTGHVTFPQLAPGAIVQTSPSYCWPGSRTVFGHVDIDGEDFTDLNWPHHEWHKVRTQINCVKVFAQVQQKQQ